MAQTEQMHTKTKLDMKVWRRLIQFARPFWRYLAILVVVMLVMALMDSIQPRLNQTAIDQFIVPGNLSGFGWFIALFIGIVLVQITATYLLVYLAGKVEVGVVHHIRTIAFNHLQNLSFSYFDTTNVGYILARMTSDCQRIADTVAWGIVDLAYGLCYMVWILIMMFSLNWQLALITMAVLPPLVIISIVFQKRILKNHRMVRALNSRITSSFNEGIMGAKTTKTLVREDANLKEFEGETQGMYKASVRASLLSASYMPIAMTLGSIGTALAIWQGGSGVIGGTLSYGVLVAFISYSTMFFDPVRDLARIFAEMQSAQAAAERVIDMIDEVPDITDRMDVVEKYGSQLAPKRENWEQITGDIVFEHVDFGYKGAGETVLRDFNLHIAPGQTIALVGETGAGKSTIVNLICRFYEPTAGRILIDGVDYRERSQLWLQSNLGYVLQQPHLFSGTVAENIRYGKLDATDEQVRRAAAMVGADGFIVHLEHGYDTEVGEGGGRLSTGQKQLISFARAIVADPRIFVLDEATSSIDTETEMAIQHAITQVLTGRTAFIVAHRLSTIRSADRILVIGEGRILEEGTHQQLLAQKGHYYELYTNQFQQEQQQQVLSGPLSFEA